MKKCALVLAVVALALVSDADPEGSLRNAALSARVNAEHAELELRVKVLEQKLEALLNGERPEKVHAIRADPTATKNVHNFHKQKTAYEKALEDAVLKSQEFNKAMSEKA